MPLPGMERPPLPPPELQAQMGMPPEGAPPQQAPPGVGGVARQAAGAPDPQGFLLAQVDAIRAVLKQIAGAEPGFAPFAQRAEQILETGVSAVSSAPKAPSMAGMSPEGPSPGRPPAPGGSGQMPPMA